MDFLQQVKHYIQAHQLIQAHQKILVAVSAGVDSVVLARTLHLLGVKMSIAHVNYGLRGEESDKDELFVRQLAEELQVPFYVKRQTISSKSSLQEQARKIRYEWFEQLTAQYGLQRIAVAHHADDQVETVMMRFLLRGTSVHGLGGMSPLTGKIIRPLLGIAKAEILSYAKANNFNFREDSSNAMLVYDRNIIRNKILPNIHAHFPEYAKNILQNIDLLRESAKMTEAFFKLKLSKKVLVKGEEISFPIMYLKKSGFAKTILWEYAQHKNFSSAQITELIKLFDAPNGKVVQSSTHRFVKHQKS